MLKTNLDKFFWYAPLASTRLHYCNAGIRSTFCCQILGFLFSCGKAEFVQLNKPEMIMHSCTLPYLEKLKKILWENIFIYRGGWSCQGKHFPVDIHRWQIPYPDMPHGLRTRVSKLVWSGRDRNCSLVMVGSHTASLSCFAIFFRGSIFFSGFRIFGILWQGWLRRQV